MIQWNVKTNRRRHIRREKKLSTAAVTELLQKLSSLKEENAVHVSVKAALTSRVAELEKLVDKLKPSQLEHKDCMALQEPWRLSRQLEMSVRVDVPFEDNLLATLKTALLTACPASHYGDCMLARNMTITGLEQVRNVRLWKNYEFRKELVRKELEGRQVAPVTSSFSACGWAHLDAAVNEVFLLHGTRPENIDSIANFGFDERLAREKGLYGQGVYFTDQSCKAFQYSGAKESAGCFVITRLILGEPHYAKGPLPIKEGVSEIRGTLF